MAACPIAICLSSCRSAWLDVIGDVLVREVVVAGSTVGVVAGTDVVVEAGVDLQESLEVETWDHCCSAEAMSADSEVAVPEKIVGVGLEGVAGSAMDRAAEVDADMAAPEAHC